MAGLQPGSDISFGASSGWRQKTHLLWNAYRLRQRRRYYLARAIRKRRALAEVSNKTKQISKGAILCVVVVRNEAARLPWFLDYHRKLGVDHFLIVDNASDDGSRELLSTQSDVSLWCTDASYRQSRFGLDWVNWLLMRYGHGHWCLVLDADELFLYAYSETRPLAALTQWLDQHDIAAMGAIMLDLYPKDNLGTQDYQPGQDPLELLSWFDRGNYTIQPQPGLNNLWIQGGVRSRLFFERNPRNGPSLQKKPLVKWNRRYAWHNSTHSLLPPKLNEIYDTSGGEAPSGVLLHTKFLPQVVNKSIEEKCRSQHFGRPETFHAYYDQLAQGPILFDVTSTRFLGWRQLEALGVMSRGGWI